MLETMRLRIFLVLMISVTCAAAATAAQIAPAPIAPAPIAPAATTQASEEEQTRFLRFTSEAADGGKLETADVTFRNPAGVTVRLVSAVHIGEQQYFESVQQSVEKCDAVLYEMIKPRDSGPPQKGAHSDSAVSKLQRFLKDQLNLSFQLDEIDYTPRNFIHADLDDETFQQMQNARGESFASLMLSALLRSMTDPSALSAKEGDPVDMVEFMTRPDGEGQIKLLLARHLGDIENEAMGLDMLSGTVILTERNKAVMKGLRKELKAGKRNVAIFYGAAHMPELAERLMDMGFEPVATEWRTAWDVKIRENAPSAFEKMMMQVGRELLRPEPAQ